MCAGPVDVLFEIFGHEDIQLGRRW
uniref:Uncharacterized protein n=1 Tax=Anguilla anguilla TaxID=7936 RepID=A0A0E9TYH5_ANGAN